MPHLRVRGLSFEILESVGDLLVESLAEMTNTPNSHFTLEFQAITYLAVGGASPAYPFFEILWFDRGEETKRKIAAFIDELVRPLIPVGQDVTVLFYDLDKSHYYENGEHF
jgi:hypothetical protein